jgi:hypothetical protein
VPRGKEFVLQNSPALLCCRIFQFLVAARKRNSRFVWPKMPGVESDPVASGYVASLAHPGGNLTGLFLDAPTLCGKWLQQIGDIVPNVTRIAALWDATTGTYQLDAIKAAATTKSIDLLVAAFLTAAA